MIILWTRQECFWKEVLGQSSAVSSDCHLDFIRLANKKTEERKSKKEISRGDPGKPSSFHHHPQSLDGEAERIMLHFFPCVNDSRYLKKSWVVTATKHPNCSGHSFIDPMPSETAKAFRDDLFSLCLVSVRTKGTHLPLACQPLQQTVKKKKQFGQPKPCFGDWGMSQGQTALWTPPIFK